MEYMPLHLEALKLLELLCHNFEEKDQKVKYLVHLDQKVKKNCQLIVDLHYRQLAQDRHPFCLTKDLKLEALAIRL